MIRVCFHGAESTGKSTLSKLLAADFGCPRVPEFGRAWAREHGTEFTMVDLLEIARGQDAWMREAAAAAPALLLLDTDPLMTAAWAAMLFGDVPPELLAYAKAEFYLLFSPDVPWMPDGTRLFGSEGEPAQFAACAEALLIDTGLPFARISGDWPERERQARLAIGRMLAAKSK